MTLLVDGTLIYCITQIVYDSERDLQSTLFKSSL